MRSLITLTFLLLGLLLSFSARAEWIMYGDNGKAEFFYDKKTIVANGKFISVMEMLNYSFPLRGVLSNRTTKEYDCSQSKFRNLVGEFFSGKNLSGDKVSESSGEDEGWRNVIGGTQNEELMNIVCGKPT